MEDTAALAGQVTELAYALDTFYFLVMSVESFNNLLELLPESLKPELNEAQLVTPTKRVLKEIEERYPGADVTLADGPDADAILKAVAESLEPPRSTP